MTRYIRAAFLLVFLVTSTACSSHQSIRYVTLDELKASLPANPVVAGFDIDDTVLFSSPGFHYGMTNHDGPDGTNKYGPNPLGSAAFWNDMNGNFDNFSLPKESGKALIAMHSSRGDKIIFITARDSSKASILPKIIMQDFRISAPDIVFTCNTPKKDFISSNHVGIYYGDADSDMEQAISANARPVRVKRSPLSNNRTSYQKVGGYGEEVLIDSEN
ncbi:MAG: acid phosphatase AphA [Chlorobiaceae bacterium]|nr:acid phosphatase AphA [Chlorobiaceae bacterium]